MRTQLVSIFIACMAADAGAAVVLPSPADRQAEIANTQEIVDPSTVDRSAAPISISLAARSDYQETDGLSRQYGSIAATAQLRLPLRSRRYSTRVLFEYSAIEQRSDAAILAAIVGYKAGDWSLSFAPYVKKTGNRSGEWKQQSTVRYRISRRSALGIELVGSLTSLSASKLFVGYYGKVSEALSVTFTIGSGVDAGRDVAFRSAVTWRVH